MSAILCRSSMLRQFCLNKSIVAKIWSIYLSISFWFARGTVVWTSRDLYHFSSLSKILWPCCKIYSSMRFKSPISIIFGLVLDLLNYSISSKAKSNVALFRSAICSAFEGLRYNDWINIFFGISVYNIYTHT